MRRMREETHQEFGRRRPPDLLVRRSVRCAAHLRPDLAGPCHVRELAHDASPQAKRCPHRGIMAQQAVHGRLHRVVKSPELGDLADGHIRRGNNWRKAGLCASVGIDADAEWQNV